MNKHRNKHRQQTLQRGHSLWNNRVFGRARFFSNGRAVNLTVNQDTDNFVIWQYMLNFVLIMRTKIFGYEEF